ncbi:MAG: hypothetical protein P8100_14270 [bacterium]|jgi:rubredoxin
MLNFYSGNNRRLLKDIHQLNKVSKAITDFSETDVIMEYVLEKKKGDEFHLVAGMKDECCKTLTCRLCGNNKLVVGQAPYFTAVKCTVCGYEVGIHEG